MVQPDNFSLYQPLVAGSLLLAGRGLRGQPRLVRRSRACSPASPPLSRNDGVLVLAVLGAVWLWDRLRGRIAFGGEAPRAPRIPFVAALGAVALFVLVVAPWYARQLAMFGSLSPSTASGKVLFIRDIGEWNSITIPATLDHLLGMGIGPLLLTPGGRLRRRGVHLLGARRRPSSSSRSCSSGPGSGGATPPSGRFFGYALLLFAFSALVSAIHVPGGTFIHSAVALAPHGYVLALLGIVAGIEWIAARRRGWDVQRRVARVRERRGRARRRRRDLRDADRPRRLGRRSGSGCRTWPPRSTRRARPTTDRADVDRRRRLSLLERPRRRRPRQRPARDGRGGRRGVRHPLARSSNATTPSPPPSRSSWATSDPAWVGPPVAGDRGGRRVPGVHGCRRPAMRIGGAAMTADPGATVAPARWTPTRREAWLSVLLVFAVAIGVRIRRRGDHRLPEARGHGVLRRRRAQPRRGPRARVRRPVELRHAAAGLPAARRSRSGCRSRRSCSRSRWRCSAGPRPIPLDVAMRASQVVPVLAGSHRLGARLAARRGRRARARPVPGARPDARARHRARQLPSTCRSSSTRPCRTRRSCSGRSSSAPGC